MKKFTRLKEITRIFSKEKIIRLEIIWKTFVKIAKISGFVLAVSAEDL